MRGEPGQGFKSLNTSRVELAEVNARRILASMLTIPNT